MGIVLDTAGNEGGPASGIISAPTSRVMVCVVPTDEERGIATETLTLLSRPSAAAGV
jgi:acetate kinase